MACQSSRFFEKGKLAGLPNWKGKIACLRSATRDINIRPLILSFFLVFCLFVFFFSFCLFVFVEAAVGCCLYPKVPRTATLSRNQSKSGPFFLFFFKDSACLRDRNERRGVRLWVYAGCSRTVRTLDLGDENTRILVSLQAYARLRSHSILYTHAKHTGLLLRLHVSKGQVRSG